MTKKIIALFVAFNFMFAQSGLAAMITPDGRTDTTVISNGNEHDIYTGTVSGNTGFNSFSNFDVYEGNTANLHLPGGTANLVNLVHDKASQIDGVLNAYKNGAIGGNVFFLNPNGIMIGAGGVVNVGALTLVTPTREFMDSVITRDRGVNSAVAQAVLAGDIPLTHSGLVSVKGTVNATDGVGIMAGTVNHAGQINTNFTPKALVNLEDTAFDNKILVKDGRVLIVAAEDFLASGAIETNGSDINITAGNDVRVNEGALISSSATGTQDAGEIYIYGANNSYFSAGAAIKATAEHGNGGFIEFSGKNLVSLDGGVFKAGSLHGIAGTVLIDPLIIAISHNHSTVDGTNIHLFATDSIIMNDGVTLSSVSSSAKSGDILIEAPKIDIGNNTTITAADGGHGAGNVTIEAKATADTPWVKEAHAHVKIGDNATIIGHDITITSEATSKLDFNGPQDEEDDSLLDSILDVTSTGVDFIDNFGLVGAVAKHDVSSKVTIGSGANLLADNNLTISSTADSDLSIMVPLTNLSVAYAENKTNSEVIIGKNAVLKAEEGDISLNSTVNNLISASAMAMSNKEVGSAPADGAVAVANMQSKNTIKVEEGASLTAGKRVEIDATTTRRMDVSASSTALDDGTLAAAVTYSHSDVKNEVFVNGLVKAGSDVTLNSHIDSLENRSVASAGAGSSTVTYYVSKPLNFAASGIKDFIKGKTEKAQQAGAAHSDFGAAAAVSYTEHHNTATVALGPAPVEGEDGPATSKADIQAGGNLEISAKIEDKQVRQASMASVDSVDKGENGQSAGYTKENGGAVAVAIADYNNNVSAYVGDNAQIDAAGNINISSVYDMPYDITWHQIESISDITQKLNGNLGIQNGFFTTWAMATASTNEESTGNGSEQGDFGFAGAFNMADFNSDTTAYIGKNVKINRRGLYEGQTSLNVKATSALSTVNLTGNTGLTFFGTDAKNGIGASVMLMNYDNNTKAYIDDGALINASDLNLTSGLTKRDITIAASGGKAESFGFNGTFNWVDSLSDTLAYISGGANINLASNLTLSASDDTQMYNFSGGVVKGESVGAGASIAFIESQRNTKAYIGQDEDEEENPSSKGGSIAAKDVTVTAGSTGDIYAVSVAASVITNKDEKPADPANPDAPDSPDDIELEDLDMPELPDSGGEQGQQEGQTKYGIAISGDASVNKVTNNSSAYINNNVNITSTGDVKVAASDDTAITSASGAASIALTKGDSATSVGIAGSTSVNLVDNKVSAYVKNAEISAKALNIDAANAVNILSISASGSAAPMAKTGVAVAGSVSINQIDNETISYIDNSTVYATGATPEEEQAALSVSSKDNSKLLAIAGGVSVAKTAGIGASVGANYIDNTVSSSIKNSTVTSSTGGISVDAINNSSITDISGTVGVALEGMAVAASVAVNKIDSDTDAYIENSTVGSDGDVKVSAENTSDMLAVAGAVGVAKGAGVGLSTAVSTINTNTKAFVLGSTQIAALGNIIVDASSDTETETSAAAGAVASNIAAAGSVAVNNIKNTTTANVENSTLLAEGSARISALSQNAINFYGGAIGAAVGAEGAAGVGGTVAVNSVSDNAYASIKSSSIDAKGNASLSNADDEVLSGLIVEAEVKDDINVYTANLGAAYMAGVAGTVSVSNIDNKALATIDNAKINQNTTGATEQDVYAAAKNYTDVDVYGGAIGAAGQVGVGAVSDTVLIDNETKTIVNASQITAKKDITLSTDSRESYDAVLISGGLGLGAAGVAGNVVVLDIESDNLAEVTASTLNSGADTHVTATDNVEVGKDIPVSVGSAAGGAYAGVGGSVFVANVNNSTKSNVLNSSINALGLAGVNAKSTETVRSVLPTLGAGGAGVAASVSVVNLDSETSAFVGENEAGQTTFNGQKGAAVKAEADSTINTVIASAGAGGVGVGGAVSVSKIDGKTSAAIGSGVTVNATDGTVEVIADSKRAIDDLVIAAGAGAGLGVAGSVSVAMIGSDMDSDSLDSSQDARSIVEEELARNTSITDLGRGTLLEGTDAENMAAFTSDVSSIFDAQTATDKGTTASIGSNVSLQAKDLLVNAIDTTQLKQTVGGGAVGAVAGVGASVAVGNIKTSSKAFIGENSDITVEEEAEVKAENNIEDSDILSVIGTGSASTALGATVAIINADNNTEAYIGDYTHINDANDLKVTADSKSDIHAQTVGVIAGLTAAAGASVAQINKTGDTLAYLRDNVTLGDEDNLGNVIIKAQTDHDIHAEAEAGSGGIISGNGTAALANISGKTHALTGKNNNIFTTGIFDLATDGDVLAKATTYGVSVGGLSVGVSVANTTVNLDNKAELGLDNTVQGKEVIIGAAQSAKTEVNATAAGGALIGGTGVDADSKITGTVLANISNGANIKTASSNGSDLISLMASADTQQEVISDLYNVGAVLSAGVNLADVEADVQTKAAIGQGINMASSNIGIEALAKSELFASGFAGNGGALAGGGTVVNTNNKSLAQVLLGSDNMALANNLAASKITLRATNTAKQDSSVSAVTGGLIGATVLDAQNNADLDAKVEVRGNTTLNGSDVELSAQNSFEKAKYAENLKSTAGGIVTVNVSNSETDINADADIILGNGSAIKTIKDSLGESSFLAEAFNDISARDKAVLTSGGLVMVPVVTSRITNNSNANINIYDASIDAAHDAVFNLKSDADISAENAISVYGLSGIANGSSRAINNITNNITFHNGADVYTRGGSILIGLSQPFGGALAQLNNKAITDIYNRTGIPIDTGSEAKGTLNVNNTVDVKSGAVLRSSKDIKINAAEAATEAKGVLNIYTALDAIELATKDGATAASNSQHSTINIDGDIKAGVNNIFNITIKNTGTLENPNYVIEGTGLDGVRYELTEEDLKNNLVSELERYKMLANTYGLDPEIKGAYLAEVARIEAELTALGLIDENGLVMAVSGVRYITFDDIFAGRGDISLNASSLTGTGNIKTAGYAEVKIDNSSDLFLRLHNVTVPSDSTGALLFNDIAVNTAADINAINGGVFGGSAISASSQAAPVIDIKNTFKDNNKAPYLEVLGDMSNLDGSINLFSTGSIYSKGNMIAQDISISSEKDIIQSYTDGFRHIGGDPKSGGQWGGVAAGHESGASATGSDNTSGAKGGQSSIIGNNIFISGRYLNLNGSIQSGVADWNLNIGSGELKLAGGLNAATARAQYDRDIAANKAGASELFALDASYGNVPAYYNVLTGEIVLADVSVSGGRLELYGHILNTGGAHGKLTVLDGYGRVNITNESAYDLVVGNVFNENEVHGIIKITDTAFSATDSQGNKQYLVTEYTRDNGQVNMSQYFTGNENIAFGGNGSDASAYRPLENQRYSWETGTSSSFEETWYKDRQEFWGMDWIAPDDESYDKTYGPSQTVALPDGEKIILGSDDDSYYSYRRTGPIEKDKVKMEDSQWTSSSGWWIFAVKHYHHRLKYRTGTMQYNSHSVKADYPISIHFIGYDTPETNIRSNTNLDLNGSISSSQGDVFLTAGGSINKIGDGIISARNLNLTAANNIGLGLGLDTRIYGGVINAGAANGSININAKGAHDASTGSLYDVKIGNITAKDEAALTAEGNIVNASSASKISGARVVLDSLYGSVGTLADFVNIEADTLSAKAQGDINIKDKGDLGVEVLHSLNGDVNLDVEGNVTDANIEKHADERTSEQLLAAWQGLDLFDQKYILKDEQGNFVTDEQGQYVYAADSWTEDQLAFAVSGTSLKNTIDTQYEVEAPNIIARNVNINAGGAVGVDSGFEDIDLRDYANLSDDKKLLIAAAEADNLLFTFEEINGEQVPVSVRVSKTEDLDIHALEALTVKAADHIYIGAEEDININSLQAGAGKKVTVYTKGGIYNASEDGKANITGGDLTMEAAAGAIGAKDKALVVDLSGKVLARAKEGIFVNSAGDIQIDSMLSDKEVVLNAGGDVLNAATPGAINIRAGGVNINAANIGSASTALGVSINQASASEGQTLALTANATGDINVTGAGVDDLYVGDITAGGDIKLASKSSLYRAGDTKISGRRVNLDYIAKDAGSSDNRLNVEADEISANIFGNLYLLANAPLLKNIFTEQGALDIDSVYSQGLVRADNIISQQGAINIMAKDDMMVEGAITAHNNTLSLLASNLFNKAGVSGVYGTEINLKARAGDIGQKDNSFMLNSALGDGLVNATAPGNIYLSGFDSNLKISSIESTASDVELIAADGGSLEVAPAPQGKANVKGNNVTLIAAQGHIGQRNAPVVTQVNHNGGKTNALAADGIYLTQLGYDLFADYIRNTRSGDIVLNVPGSHLRIDELVKADGFEVNFGANRNEGLIAIGGGSEMSKTTIDPLALRVHSTAAQKMLNHFRDVQPERFNFDDSDWLNY